MSLHTGSIHCTSPSALRRSASAAAPLRSSDTTQCAAHSVLRSRGFSLIEVVLAMGIVSFAILTVIGLFGGVMKAASENRDRRELVNSIDSLRNHLTASVGFTNCYRYAQAGATLAHIDYYANAAAPTNAVKGSDAQFLFDRWIEANDSKIKDLDDARGGVWVRCRLSLSPSNPGGALPPQPKDYPYSYILLHADLDIANVKEQLGKSKNEELATSRIQTTIPISK